MMYRQDSAPTQQLSGPPIIFDAPLGESDAEHTEFDHQEPGFYNLTFMTDDLHLLYRTLCEIKEKSVRVTIQ